MMKMIPIGTAAVAINTSGDSWFLHYSGTCVASHDVLGLSVTEDLPSIHGAKKAVEAFATLVRSETHAKRLARTVVPSTTLAASAALAISRAYLEVGYMANLAHGARRNLEGYEGERATVAAREWDRWVWLTTSEMLALRTETIRLSTLAAKTVS